MRRAELEAIAASIPTPVDDGGPARAYVGIPDGDAWQVYFGIDGARRREYVGPRFSATTAADGSRNGAHAARAATALAEILNARAGA